jgi:hypothetical protein
MQGYARHPKYKATTAEAFNDIAIARLSGLSKQPYVNLSSTPPSKGQALTAIGWGGTPDPKNDDGTSKYGSEILRYGIIHILIGVFCMYTFVK